MKRYRRLIEPAAILLLVISAILPGWLSIAAGASALILLIALAASHFTGKKRLAVVVGLVAVLAVVFYINGQRNAKVQAGAAFEGMVEVTNRSLRPLSSPAPASWEPARRWCKSWKQGRPSGFRWMEKGRPRCAWELPRRTRRFLLRPPLTGAAQTLCWSWWRRGTVRISSGRNDLHVRIKRDTAQEPPYPNGDWYRVCQLVYSTSFSS